MSALAQEQSTAVQLLESVDLARELPSDVLYQLEAAGQLATEILDERVIQWTEDGWSQRKIAEELGCSHTDVRRRQQRLDVQPKDNRGGARLEHDVPNLDGDSEVVDAEPVPDTSEIAPRRRVPRVEDDRAAHYLPDLVSEDADFHPRTQALNWFDQGQRLQRLLSSRTPLTVRSDEDRTAMEKEAAGMARLATRLKEAIHSADID